MEESRASQPGPYRLELEPGRYRWCSCGRSATQPFCDRSHVGTPFGPIEFVIEEKRRISLCGCRRSKEGARCDGAHKTEPPS